MDTLAYRHHIMYKRQAPLTANATQNYETHIFGQKHHHTRNASETAGKYSRFNIVGNNIQWMMRTNALLSIFSTFDSTFIQV